MKKLVMMVVVISLLSGGCVSRQIKIKQQSKTEMRKIHDEWQWKNRHRFSKERQEFLERARKKSEQMDRQRRKFAEKEYRQIERNLN